jgi:hypothetical protein
MTLSGRPFAEVPYPALYRLFIASGSFPTLMDGNQPGTLCALTARSQRFEEFMPLIEIPNAYLAMWPLAPPGDQKSW